MARRARPQLSLAAGPDFAMPSGLLALLRALGLACLLVWLLRPHTVSAQSQPVPPMRMTCTGDVCTFKPTGASPAPTPSPAAPASLIPHPRLARVARGAAIFGLVSAALTLSGSITLGVMDSERAERIGRGVMLGLTVASTPAIGIPALIVRRRTRAKGIPALRNSLWGVWLAAITTDGFYLYRALHDDQVPLGSSILAGTIAAVSVLGFAVDAFICSRQARSYGFAVNVNGRGLDLRLRF